MQLVDIVRDDDSFRVLPRSTAYAIAGIGGLGAARAEVCAPESAACADRSGERLAMVIRSDNTAQIRAFATACARDEERYRIGIPFLRVGAGG
jgi:hypothetical protein